MECLCVHPYRTSIAPWWRGIITPVPSSVSTRSSVDRALVFGTRCRTFESCRVYQVKKTSLSSLFYLAITWRDEDVTFAKQKTFGGVSETKESAVGIFFCERTEEAACCRYRAGCTKEKRVVQTTLFSLVISDMIRTCGLAALADNSRTFGGASKASDIVPGVQEKTPQPHCRGVSLFSSVGRKVHIAAFE